MNHLTDLVRQLSRWERSAWRQWISFLIISATSLSSCSPGVVAAPDVVDTWKPPAGVEAASPVSCEEVGSLFSYDAQASLEIQEEKRQRGVEVTTIHFNYASPLDGCLPSLSSLMASGHLPAWYSCTA